MGGCHFGNLAVEMSTQDEFIREKVKAMFESGVATFEQVFREAVAAGDLPAIDVSLAAHALQAYLEGVVFLAKTWNDPEMIRRLAPGAAQLVMLGKH